MKVRDFLLFGAAATSLVLSGTVSMADNAAPLAAGGPAAQAESGPAIGTVVEIGGILFVVTVAGLVAVSNDKGAPPTATTTPEGSTPMIWGNVIGAE